MLRHFALHLGALSILLGVDLPTWAPPPQQAHLPAHSGAGVPHQAVCDQRLAGEHHGHALDPVLGGEAAASAAVENRTDEVEGISDEVPDRDSRVDRGQGSKKTTKQKSEAKPASKIDEGKQTTKGAKSSKGSIVQDESKGQKRSTDGQLKRYFK